MSRRVIMIRRGKILPNMIPNFPDFKIIELSDRESIFAITKKFEPYSDFDFGNIIFWDYTEKMLISKLNENLVIKFNDYLTGEYFYTFIGVNEVEATTETLLQHAKHVGIQPILKLIPEIVVNKMLNDKFSKIEDVDNLDYIVSVDKLLTYDGHELAAKRRAVSIFSRRTPNSQFKVIDLHNELILKDIERLFILWHTQKVERGESTADSGHEYTALKRCLTYARDLNILGTGLYVADKLVAFWLIGMHENGYCISHFEKADTNNYQGIFPFFKQKVAAELLSRNIKFINLEQDLGIPGLRQSKSAYLPVKFLKKYIIQEKVSSII